MEVERLKLRKCPEFPTFSEFLARLPLGAGDGVERKDPSRDFSSVGSELNERQERGNLRCSPLNIFDLQNMMALQRKKLEILPTCLLPLSSYSSSKFCKSQRMPLNILAAEEKLSKCCCKAGVPRMKP